MKKVGWAILGPGSLANERIAPGINLSENSRLVAVCGSHESTPDGMIQDFARRHGVPHWYPYSDLDGFFANSEVDAIYVSVPNAYHSEFVKKAASAGKHVFCEKPMATTIEECQQMIDACNEAGVKLGIAFMFPFHPASIHARQIIRSGELGEIRLIRSTITFDISGAKQSWRWNPRISGGGPIIEAACHCVDIMDFLIESPVVEVNAMTDKRHSKGEVEEMGTILLRYANGAMGIVTVSNVLPATGDYGRCFDVHGTKASLVGVGNLSRNPTGMLILQQENGISQRFTYGGHMATLWAGEVSEFSRCIIEDDVPRANGRHGMRNLQVLLAAYDSAFSEKIVKLDVEENTR